MSTREIRKRNVRKEGAVGVMLAIIAINSLPATSSAASKKRATARATSSSRSALEERVRILERRLEERDRPAAGKGAAPAGPVGEEEVKQIVDDKLKAQKLLAGWQDGFFLQSAGGDFKLKLRGYGQVDARFFPLEQGDTGTDQIYLRRLRPTFEGTVYKYFDYRFMLDFGQGTSVLQDGYLRVNYWPYAQLTAGKMKSPVSLERLQSGGELTFIERSIANNLAPNREMGITLGGSVLDGALSYQAGVFNGQFDGGNNDADVTSDKDFEGRIWAEPFKNSSIEPLKGLGFGIGGSYGTAKRESISSLTYKTAGRSNFLKVEQPKDTSVFTDGERFRFSPSLYYYYGPFGLMGEYIASNADLLSVQKVSKRPDVVTRGSLNADGWFVQASYILTGEQNAFKQVNPINSFDPANGRWGAFELAGRVSQVDLDHEAFDSVFFKRGNSTSKAFAYTGGLNWYLNKNFKFQVNWEHMDFGDDFTSFANGPGKKRDHEDVFLTRFQISY